MRGPGRERAGRGLGRWRWLGHSPAGEGQLREAHATINSRPSGRFKGGLPPILRVRHHCADVGSKLTPASAASSSRPAEAHHAATQSLRHIVFPARLNKGAVMTTYSSFWLNTVANRQPRAGWRASHCRLLRFVSVTVLTKEGKETSYYSQHTAPSPCPHMHSSE